MLVASRHLTLSQSARKVILALIQVLYSARCYILEQFRCRRLLVLRQQLECSGRTLRFCARACARCQSRLVLCTPRMLVLLPTYHQPLLNTYYPPSFVHISYAHDTPADLARGMTNVMPSNGLSTPRQYHTVLTREDFFLEAFLTVCLEVAYHLSTTRIRLLLSFLPCFPF